MLKVKKERQLPDVPRPCDVFDLIGGTSTGGLIAILLGRLQLTVSEAQEEYAVLSERIFGKKKGSGHHGQYSAAVFEKEVQKVVVKYGHRAGAADTELKLLDQRSQPTGCRVCVYLIPHPAPNVVG